MDDNLLSAIEAVLMVVDEPVSESALAQATGAEIDVIRQALKQLQAEYRGDHGRQRGFELQNNAGGWRIYSSPRWADIVGNFVIGSDTTQLSQAALETLAIVAYRQPITRSQVSHIRGVNVDSVMRSLVTRGLLEETGESPTGAKLYSTTSYFLECMGFETLEELVPLAPFLPEADMAEEIEATLLEVE